MVGCIGTWLVTDSEGNASGGLYWYVASDR